MRPFFSFLLLLASVFAVLIPRADADTVFHYTSESGDYIGKGQERTLTPAGGYTISASYYTSSNISFSISGVSGTPTAGEFYDLQFAAPSGSSLAVGNYPGATRYPFQTANQPGLNFDANGAGSNTLTGQFQILEITFDTSGHLATFAANFVQHSENAAPASYGQIRYNSSVPYASPAGVAQLAVNNASIIETAGSLTLSATRRDGSTGPLSVTWSTADGTDRAGRDYTATSGTLSWAAGDTANKTFTIPILNSGDPMQGNGTFFVNLSGAGTGAQTQATVTVVNDNSSVTFVRFVSDAGDYIGGGLTRVFNIEDGYLISVSRNYDGGVSFSWNNSAAVSFQDSQYWDAEFASATGTIFGVGDYENATRFPFQEGSSPGLNISGDGRGSNQLTGNFQVLEAVFDNSGNVLHFAANFVQHSEGGPAALRGQVRYNSTVPLPVFTGSVQFSAAAYSVAENAGKATITVNRTGGNSGALSVNYATADGTATGGTNYTPTFGTLTWADGDSASKTFTVPVTDDGVYTANLALNLTLTGSAVGAIPQATLTLLNQDPSKPGTLQFSGASYAASDTDGTVTITVNRTGGSNGAISARYATANGTAVSGTDYVSASGTLYWADGDSAPKTFTIPLLDPVTTFASQTVSLTLSGTNVGALNKATLTITNRNFPSAGTLALSTVNYTANETDGAATITVVRTGGSYGAVSINYATADGTATAGQDYVSSNGVLSWSNGDNSPKTFTVPILNARISGGGLRTLAVQLTGSNLGAAKEGTLTITDNYVVPTTPVVSVVASPAVIQEKGGVPGVFTILRTGDTSAPLTVFYKVGGSAAGGQQYQALKGSKTIKAGKASVNVKVSPIDTGATGGGKVVVKLTLEPQDGGYIVAGSGMAKVKILQND